MDFLVRVGGGFVLFMVVGTMLCGIVYVTIWTVNRGIQFMADKIGIEITDFWDWLSAKFTERKKKNGNPER